jgi:hypothetical protein
MKLEPELKAMGEVYSALKALEDDARQRVIDWVVGKFALKPVTGQSGESFTEAIDLRSFESVADSFAHANHKSDPEKVLIVGAYLQQKQGNGELTGREINKQLKHLGHPVKNITNVISSLINKKPKLMIQTRKEGKSQQAQKKYKVTIEGFAAAKKLINL